MSINQRPPFHHYPLSIQQLVNIKQEKESIEKDIRDNLIEIRLFNNKIARNDSEQVYLSKLKQRERILHSKHDQLQEILETSHFLQDQLDKTKKQNKLRSSLLAKEYQSVIEQKKKKEIEEKKKEIEMERKMIQYNHELFQIDTQRRKKEIQQKKRLANEQFTKKEAKKRMQIDEKNKEKEAFLKKMEMRNKIETQKETSYKQYYNQFKANQNDLHTVYEKKAARQNEERQRTKKDFLSKQVQQYTRQQESLERQRIQKEYQEKYQLKNYLQKQIRQKQMRKSFEGEMRRSFHEEARKYEQRNREQDQFAIQRKKQEQHRYGQELTAQIKLRKQINGQNQSFRQRHQRKDPIQLRFGLSYPYVSNEEEHKQKVFIQREGKLNNLIKVGTNSLHS